MNTHRLVLPAILAVALMLSWVSTSLAEPVTVKIDNFTFNPAIVKVKPGDTVNFTNQDDIPHTVVATNHAFKSKALDTGDSFSYTFTTPGEYAYFCSLHPHMKGTIIVEIEASQK